MFCNRFLTSLPKFRDILYLPATSSMSGFGISVLELNMKSRRGGRIHLQGMWSQFEIYALGKYTLTLRGQSYYCSSSDILLIPPFPPFNLCSVNTILFLLLIFTKLFTLKIL